MNRNMPGPKTLGAVLRLFRLRKGISQETLAELANLHRTYVGGVERGERNPSFLTLSKLLLALEVSWSDFGKALIQELTSEDGEIVAETKPGHLCEIANIPKGSLAEISLALKSKNVFARRVAAWILQKTHQNREAWFPVLIRALDDEDEGVRHYAAKALFEMIRQMDP